MTNKIINIAITNKVAEADDSQYIVCGNSDYLVHFDFDSEWDAYPKKTAQFRYCVNNKTACDEILFSGDTVAVPVLRDITRVEVGVIAGDIRTTTPVTIKCKPCITDGSAVPHEPPPPDIYNQLLEKLNEIIASGGVAPGTITGENVDVRYNDEDMTLAAALLSIGAALKDAGDCDADGKIRAAIDMLLDGAPQAYDTLGKIAAYITAHQAEYAELAEHVAENHAALEDCAKQAAVDALAETVSQNQSDIKAHGAQLEAVNASVRDVEDDVQGIKDKLPDFATAEETAHLQSLIEQNQSAVAETNAALADCAKQSDVDALQSTVEQNKADADAQLSEVSDAVSTLTAEVGRKVDAVDGKGLSTEDYTADDKQKLASLPGITDADVAQIGKNRDDISQLGTQVNAVGTDMQAIRSELPKYAQKTEVDTLQATVTQDRAALVDVVNDGRKNLSPIEHATATKRLVIPLVLQPGRYIVSFDSISSTDTDAKTCKVLAMYRDTEASTSAYLSREKKVHGEFTVTKECDAVYVYASDTFANGEGDEVNFTGMMICKKTIYDIDPSFQPYAMSNREMTDKIESMVLRKIEFDAVPSANGIVSLNEMIPNGTPVVAVHSTSITTDVKNIIAIPFCGTVGQVFVKLVNAFTMSSLTPDTAPKVHLIVFYHEISDVSASAASATLLPVAAERPVITMQETPEKEETEDVQTETDEA